MMSLGQFVFSLTTVPFVDLQRQRNWRHATSSRIGVMNASQFTGPGDDTITLNGIVAPETIGSIASIDELAEMAGKGEAYVLVDGQGSVYGLFVIESLNETQTFHTQNGVPRRIEFALALKRVPDNMLAQADKAAKN